MLLTDLRTAISTYHYCSSSTLSGDDKRSWGERYNKYDQGNPTQ